MSVVRLRYHESPPDDFRGGIVAVGNFDGVHLGHQSLLAAAREWGDPAVAVSFDPHPMQILAPQRYQLPLTTIDDRSRLLLEIGFHRVVILHTTPELLSLSPEYFFETIIAFALGARGMVEGFNFRFGKDRAGSNDTLRELCVARSMFFREVPAFESDGVVVSSSKVREAIQKGDIPMATRLLGREYSVRGLVVPGAKRGRTIGFPTANLDQVPTLLPAEGVYAVRVHCNDDVFTGAANIGPNPTFGEDARKIEVHLLDFAGNLYDQPLTVDFVARLRETRKFSGVEALIEQMNRDIAATRDILRPKRSQHE